MSRETLRSVFFAHLECCGWEHAMMIAEGSASWCRQQHLLIPRLVK